MDIWLLLLVTLICFMPRIMGKELGIDAAKFMAAYRKAYDETLQKEAEL